MLRVSVEGIVKNILITEDAIYFEDDMGKYKSHPCNRYAKGTDSYEASEMFLFNEAYLNFNVPANVEAFKDYCIRQYRNDIYVFTYDNVRVVMDFIEDGSITVELD